MDLVETCARCRQMRRAGASYSPRLRRRLAVLRLARQPPHRAVPPPDRRPAPTPPNTPDPRCRSAATRRSRPTATGSAQLQRHAAGLGLHDRLRRQVPQRVRDPGPASSRRCRRAGRLCGVRLRRGRTTGWGFESTWRPTGRLQHPHPRTAARRRPTQEGRGLRRQRHRGAGPGVHPAHRDDDAPYFLEVAPYAPHSRTTAARLPGRPAVPAGVRGPARRPVATATAGRSPATSLDPRACRASATTSGDNAPRTADGRRARQWRPDRPLRPAQSAARPARPGQDGAVDRPDRAPDPRRVGPDTYVVLTSDNGFHLGQHGLGRGKGTPYDSDVHVPLLVIGPGVVPARAPS